MYEIYYNNSILYYPGDKEFSVSEAALNQSVGESGQFNMTIPPNNPLFDSILERQAISIMRDGKEFWNGDIREISTNFVNQKTIYCLEDLAYLGEVIKYAHSVEKSYTQYFTELLTEYNSKVGPDKQFKVGYILKKPNIVQTFTFETMSILEILRAIAGDDYYVRVRRINGERYIDIVNLENYSGGAVNEQSVTFGDNMMDFVKESNTSWLLSAILPVGAETGTETIEGIQDRVTIESVNAGSKILINATAASRYGYIEKLVEFKDVISPSELKELAETYLRENSQPRLTMDISAVDLSTISNVDSYNLGDLIHIDCVPFGINQNVSLCDLEIDLMDPSNNQLTLSSYVERKSFTDIQNQITAEVEKIPTKAEFLEAAKKNAMNIITGTEGGYVHFIMNPQNIITDIVILNAETDELATRKWVFNSGGLGHFVKENGTWSSVNVAMTMDGAIVADMITSGILASIQIQGCDISTINGGRFYSPSNGQGSTLISGGRIVINNTADAFLQIQNANNPRHYVTFGAERWTVAREDEGYYVQFDPKKLADLASRA